MNTDAPDASVRDNNRPDASYVKLESNAVAGPSDPVNNRRSSYVNEIAPPDAFTLVTNPAGSYPMLALLIGTGGRDVSGEIAAGRAIGRYLAVGDRVTVGEISGTISAMQPTVVIVDTASGTVAVRNSVLHDGPLAFERQPTTRPEPA